MLTSLSLIFLVGLAMGAICQRLKLPRIIGMLATGMILGPYVLDFLDPSILSVSAELRKMALIIILLKAGLSLDLNDLKKAGRSAVLLSFLPATCEIIAYLWFAPLLLGINHAEAAVMGAVLAAVSPAVVVPRMVTLMEKKYGTEKAIPQMIMAGASCDDIFVIVLGFSFLLISIENWLEGKLAVSGLLAVVSMACVIRMKSSAFVSKRLSEKFGKLWLAAEVILFVLVGAAVDIRYTLTAGIAAIAMIFLALLFRSLGVFLCTIKTALTWRERLFCIIAYLPKATVQAAIGSVPLSAGLPCGNIVLSVAVLAIIITAPLGALGMDSTYKRLLQRG